MEQVVPEPWPFDISPDTPVVTTTYVTRDGHPIRYVTHEHDEEEGVIWQFHCGNGDYSARVLQLIRLDEILEIDRDIVALAQLPLGFCAKRANAGDTWVVEKEEHPS